MSLVKNFAFGAFIAGCTGMISTPSYAFMMDAAEVTAAGTIDMTQTVDQLRQELKTGETKCDVMLTKIDSAIEEIDKALDNGVVDEKKYLGLRDELVEMRLDLPCLANELAQGEGDTVISETVIGETVVGPTSDEDRRIAGAPFGGSGGFAGSAGGGGGSGLGGGIGGAGGLGRLALLGGVAAAIAIPVATGNNNPGVAASPVK